ncbi:acyltransferase [Xanthobacter autotrophicus DSM 597]|uniref:acyltransferase family protein n=1 Tax=Xanthobacter wiegelii TaxID=3119913 RepID=UPI0037276F55
MAAKQRNIMTRGGDVSMAPDPGDDRKPVKVSEPMSIFLDHVRWISALLVVIGHIRQIYFVDYHEIAHPSTFWAAFYGITRLSHQAVLMFFLISGAVIAGRFMHASGWQNFSFTSYAVARLTRLWLVLLPVVTVCVALLIVTPARYLPDDCTLSTIQVLGNIFFTQEILVAPLCNNVPLWSLANEFWYYAIVGVAVFVMGAGSHFARITAAIALLACIAIIAANDAFTEKNVLAYFPVWVLGAVVFLPRLSSPPVSLGLGALAVAALVVRSPSLPFDFYVRDLIFAGAAFLALLSVRDISAESWFAKLMLRTSAIARPLAGQSYSLYLIHYPIVILFLPLGFDAEGIARQQPSASGVGLMIVILAACYIAAHASYLLLESKTHLVRARVSALLAGSHARARPPG